MIKIRYYFIFCFVILLSACNSQQPVNDNKENKKNTSITISAASSLHDVLGEIENEYKKEHPTSSLVFNFGGSGSLMQQIEKGAPIDLFIFADQKKADQLLEKGFAEKDTVTNFLGNQLVLVMPNESSLAISETGDLINNNIKRIAIGTPEIVPAGYYSKQALQTLKLWDTLEKKMVFTKDVRQVLTYVETGNVDAGLVYLTDAMHSKKTRIATHIPDTTHDSIVYSTGLISTSKQKKEAKKFLTFLLTDQAKAVYKKYGFIVLE